MRTRRIPNFSRASKFFVLALAAASLLGPKPTSAQQVQFTKLQAQSQGEGTEITAKESSRIERFLSRVFPTRAMKRFDHDHDKAIARRVSYAVVSQQGRRFVVAGFSGRWRDAIDVLGIYRLEKTGPNQVWRSTPWQSNYYGWRFTNIDLGSKALLLLQEGAEENNFGLASIISFQNAEKGLIIHDLTPSLPRLRAFTSFPFRPLYAQDIKLRMSDDTKPAIILSASDEEFELSSYNGVRPTTEWRYNRARSRFERGGSHGSGKGAMTTLR